MQHSLNPHSMPGTVASSSNKEEEGWGKEREEEKKKKEDEMKRKMIAHTCWQVLGMQKLIARCEEHNSALGYV